MKHERASCEYCDLCSLRLVYILLLHIIITVIYVATTLPLIPDTQQP